MAKKTEQKKSESHTGLLILGGIAAAAAAGAYFAYGNKDVQKKIRKAKSWAIKAKGEALHKIEALKHVDEEIYNKVIDTVVKKYENVKNIDVSELAAVSKELKGYWKSIKKELSQGTGAAKKTVKKAVKAGVNIAKDAKKAVSK